ncbi:carbon-nitrogen hydrolase family protein [Planctomycetes bacterium K23_9]|uniref:Apolipoprotein N-acyltransferase n=1 Tax=Stieleria marina TaxID=1930275 RepID=A0A517NRC2_9BACT|nr:apolipoprotein N-acyltransferase [Planctomycetes bacterium K23_9]
MNLPLRVFAAMVLATMVLVSAPAKAQDGKKKGFITVATIGASPLTVSGDTKPQKVVDRVIAHWRNQFSRVLPDRPDLIVVPEVCDRPRGLSPEAQDQYFITRGTQVQEFFATVARENHCYIVYSAKRAMDDGTWRNSSMMLDRQGNVAGIYDKNHPTIGEIDKGILCGNKAPIVECDFGRVAMAICFDLNFDELRQQYVEAQPDLILFSSMYHGGMMQQYWAYSCRCHFVGAIAGRATPSQIRNPLGIVVASNTNYFDHAVARINLDCALVHLDENWGRLSAMKAKYGPKVKITDPGELGSVLIASEHDTISIDAMIAEFELERLDDYMARSLSHRMKPAITESVKTKP